jgi:hypothetical protein
VRVIAGSIVAIVTAFVFGVIMGEYELRGPTALIAGVLFGLAIAECVITVGKTDEWALAGVAGACAFLGLTYAAYIDRGGDYLSFDSGALGRITVIRWIGSVLALACATAWVRMLGSRAIHNPMRPEYEPQEPTER